MLGYFLFYLLIALCLMIKDQGKALKAMFVVITLFSGLRYGIGYDYYSYLECCSPYSMRGERFEFIPEQMVRLSQASFPYLFFILSSLFISFFYFMAIKVGGKDYPMEVLFYIGFPFLFFNQMGIIRQGMASSVVFLAIVLKYSDIGKRKLLFFRLSLLAVAIMCHQSAFVGVLIFIPWEKVSKNVLWLLFISSFLIGTLITPIMEDVVTSGILSERDSEKAVYYLNTEAHGEGNIIKWLIYFIGAFALMFYDKLIKRSKKNAYYIGILILGVSLFSLFSYNSSLSKRLCIFFFTTSILLIPQMANIVNLNKSFYSFLCASLLTLQVYISSSNIRIEDDPGCSVSYPYRTFVSIMINR